MREKSQKAFLLGKNVERKENQWGMNTESKPCTL